MTTTILGVLGFPVSHSKSPAMHGAAIAALGLDARYLPFAVHPDAVGDAVRGIRALGIRGVNVTLPHKQAVMAHLDRVDPDARAIGAVNTIVNDDGVLSGFNTDAPGLVRSIEEAGISLAGLRVTVLGAGGAARAAVVGVARAGAAEIAIVARREDAARQLAVELGPALEGVAVRAAGYEEMPALFAHTDLLVQGTSATLVAGGAGAGRDAAQGEGAEAFAALLPIDALPASAAVVDLVYQPLETTVLRRAAAQGLRTIDGLGMLVHQGALAFRLFLGVEAPVEVMGAALGRPPAATMAAPRGGR